MDNDLELHANEALFGYEPEIGKLLWMLMDGRERLSPTKPLGNA